MRPLNLTALSAALLLSWAPLCRAQSTPVLSSSTVNFSTMALLGMPLTADSGPWVIGDAQFRGNRGVSEVALRNRIRARRGVLFTNSDLEGDLAELRRVPSILKADAALYGLLDQPVPENYRSISVSTMMVRVIYTVEEDAGALPGLSPQAAAPPSAKNGKDGPPVSMSGVVMTPTAYRGVNQYNRPGLGLDIDAVYFIGRLYGKNSLTEKKTNYIDRLGVWFLTADAKMQVQSETTWRPAMAVGVHGILTLRDSPQPAINDPQVTTKVSPQTTRMLSDVYGVMTKKLLGIRASVGFAEGNSAERVAMLTEFLRPDALFFLSGSGSITTQAKSKDTFFASLVYAPNPSFPLAVEVVKPNGMILNPVLYNFKIGHFLKLNFDVSLLTFKGGWDALGTFQFRYTHFPRTVPKK